MGYRHLSFYWSMGSFLTKHLAMNFSNCKTNFPHKGQLIPRLILLLHTRPCIWPKEEELFHPNCAFFTHHFQRDSTSNKVSLTFITSKTSNFHPPYLLLLLPTSSTFHLPYFYFCCLYYFHLVSAFLLVVPSLLERSFLPIWSVYLVAKITYIALTLTQAQGLELNLYQL